MGFAKAVHGGGIDLTDTGETEERERVISDQMLGILLFVLQLLRAPPPGCSSVP